MILWQENILIKKVFSLMKNLNADQKVLLMADKLKTRISMRAVSNLKFSMPMLSSFPFFNVEIKCSFNFIVCRCAAKEMQIHTYTYSHINDFIEDAFHPNMKLWP